jgi:prepilin-type N-terminal cleavage/methylation domain-containing protein
MIKNKQQGVTLIELLTVIVIIGILASVVLVSLDLARKRARDSTVQRQMSELRNIAEASFDWQDGYERLENMVGDDTTELEKIKSYILEVGTEETEYDGDIFDIKFSTDDKNYCAWARFISEPTEIFCVDSSGRAERGIDDEIECYGGEGVSCEETAECTVDADCMPGKDCVGGECVVKQGV